MSDQVPVLILGAGAAGLMCAAHAGPGTVVIDHNRAPGEKIRISGGGRCNFTNLGCTSDAFLSANPHFAKSALSRYTQWDFLDLLARHGVGWHEKTLGQLFCDERSARIIEVLTSEAAAAGAELRLSTRLIDLGHADGRFVATIETEGQRRTLSAAALVVACGGLSIPKMGASGLAYDIARQFGLPLRPTRPALVPFTFADPATDLAGLSCPARVRTGDASFDEALLFTHRGMSGPAVLQVSSYWSPGQDIAVTLRPDLDVAAHLRAARASAGRRDVATVLAEVLPRRLASFAVERSGTGGRLADLSDARLADLTAQVCDWRLTPTGTEGYRKAEVTAGGVDTAALDSRSMQARDVPGLYVIGEAVDVTGWLGGYNFQWAWSSGWAAAQAIATARHNGRARLHA